MNSEPQWDATRWRDAHRTSPRPGPPLSAPVPRDNGRGHSVLVRQDQSAWDSTSFRPINTERQSLEPAAHADFRHGADPSGPRSWSPRNYLPSVTRPPPEQSFNSPRARPAEAWQYHNDSSRRSSVISRPADHSLTLQIPKHADLPRVLPALAGPLRHQASETRQHPQPGPTSLPPLASLHENVHRNDELRGSSQAGSMLGTSSCRSCDDLKPIIRELAIAVAELDETVQSRCRKSITRTHDYPQEGSLRVVQWVLDRLESAKGDIKVVEPWSNPNRRESPRIPFATHASPSSISNTGALKRPSDATDFAQLPALKRRRSGSFSDRFFRSSSMSGGQDDNKMPMDHAGREGAANYSPPDTDSLPGSAHPRQQSPNMHGRHFRPLPSPSSVAYPPTIASSAVGPAPLSVSSPTNSHHPGSSIHTVSTSSVASQHIAELQHQVTLKSLSLQSLQSEYSGLLQKFHRERTKTQVIEKKTTVADKELNDLINKNEDLTEQVKGLEAHVEELEKKRESEREAAAREKEQYGRMLDMGGRLNSKVAEEKRKLSEEKAQLETRVQAYERENAARFQQLKSTFSERLDSPRRGSPLGEQGVQTSSDRESTLASTQKENTLLKTRIKVLRSALEDTERQASRYREEQYRLLQGGVSDMIDTAKRALQAEHASDVPDISSREDPANLIRKLEHQPPLIRPTERAQPLIATPARHIPAKPTVSTNSGTQVFKATLPSQTEMAKIGRARSPGAAELGFGSPAPKSSPEEILKALGPVPASSILPAWKPPAHRGPSPASAAKRTASGPLTPFPGTESGSWRSYTVENALESGFSRRSPPSGKDSKSPPTSETAARNGPEKTPALPGSRAQQAPLSVPMPPPPRPGAAVTPTTSWRPQ